ncbi:uncharacterized protein V6R79_009395 [Siganus canaliculatus]
MADVNFIQTIRSHFEINQNLELLIRYRERTIKVPLCDIIQLLFRYVSGSGLSFMFLWRLLKSIEKNEEKLYDILVKKLREGIQWILNKVRALTRRRVASNNFSLMLNEENILRV